ncbi:MAG: hypothetical protein JO297_18140 [Nitrososphaeraceae archaeon]|nr:hypothetical protein [Nitrososphaeraceae archaeon]
MTYRTSIVITLSVVGMILFTILSATNVIYAQHVTTTNKQQVPPSSSPSSSISKSHTVKITSPAKGQQVPIGKDLVVSGITGDTSSTATSDCQAYVIVNGVKPYQQAKGTGQGGAADYSKWNFVLTSKYTTIKPGPANKITAKYICSNNPSVPSFYSVNVTGGAMITSVGASHAVNPTSMAIRELPKQNEPIITTNNPSVGGNGTITSAYPGLHPPDLIYLGTTKLPGLSQKHLDVPVNKDVNTLIAPSKSTNQDRSITSINTNSEFDPNIFPFGP